MANPGRQRLAWIRTRAPLLLLLSVVALGYWLSTRYTIQADWTWRQRGSLTSTSIAVLEQLSGPIAVQAFVRQDKLLRARIEALLERYRRYKPDLVLEYVNPDLHPRMARELGIRSHGQLLVGYDGRSERLDQLSEPAMTALLQRLGTDSKRPLQFLSGHGERAPLGAANFDLGDLGTQLRDQGYDISVINPVADSRPPEPDAVLVIAGPSSDLLGGEIAQIGEHIDRGGNLMWLLDPDPPATLKPLLSALDLQILPGVVVDATTRMFGIEDPAFALITRYPPHPVTKGLEVVTLFPQAVGLETIDSGKWQVIPVLQTLQRSWTETGPVSGQIKYDPADGERAGPITIGVALTRERPEGGEQRILVVGDGDFLANNYLGNGGNLELGLNAIRWLSDNDQGVNVILQTAPDRQLQLSERALVGLSVLFLMVAPLALAGVGVLVWWRRRQ